MKPADNAARDRSCTRSKAMTSTALRTRFENTTGENVDTVVGVIKDHHTARRTAHNVVSPRLDSIR
ncbi:hypothetical protein SAMN06309944_0725 [Micrococcales bacterium KH10]|nr:hypothetical protein SAMN06309944_0725 [Micrococcales bacterium KH10]